MSTQLSTAISHLILAGTGTCCLLYTWNKLPPPIIYPCTTFGCIIGNSLVGLYRWGTSSHGSDVAPFYDNTSYLEHIAALPCIVSSVWLHYGHMPEISHAHSILALIPITTRDDNAMQVILGANCVSLGAMSVLHQNYYCAAACVSYTVAHMFFWRHPDDYFMPSEDLNNYCLCVFAVCSLMTLLN